MSTKDDLLASLVSIGKDSSTSDDRYELFSKCFLDYSSETPDNLACIENLTLTERDSLLGLSLKSGESVSDILNSAEGDSIPQQVQDVYPNLTQVQWDAVLRLSTIILTLFERS